MWPLGRFQGENGALAMNDDRVSTAKMTALPVYSVEDGDIDRDRQAVIDIWRGNLGSEEILDERYDSIVGSPFGPPMLKLLRHGPSGQRVGVGLLGPRRMLWRGREIRAGVLAYFAVIPEHRSLGPALMLQNALLESSCNHFDLVYSMPEQGARAVFKRVGYAVIGEMVRYVKVIRHAHYLERMMPRIVARTIGPLVDCAFRLRDLASAQRTRQFNSQWSTCVDARMDELWHHSDHGDALVSIRDTRMLRWRFDEAPVATIRYLLVSHADGNRLAAWFACEADPKTPSTLQVTDFWSADSGQAMEREFIDILASHARQNGYASISLNFAGGTCKLVNWTAARFVERSKSPVFGRWHDHVLHGKELIDMHLTFLDNDG